ncbi:MAG: RNA ligase family protein [Archangium sp.]
MVAVSGRMEHRAYPRIPQKLAADTGGPWVATEKLHGANLVVAFDGARVRIGKRKAWLADDEAFFGWQLLRASLEASVVSVWKTLSVSRNVRLHGELIGGAYPGLPSLPGLSAVQTGCWYDPGLRFVTFDVVVDETFLAHSELGALGLEVVPLLGRGTRGELEKLPVIFESTYAVSRGLPRVPRNFAEGYVLKPDARWWTSDRPIVKRKHPDFDDARFDDSKAWAPRRSLRDDEWLILAALLVNPARLASARSKIGEDAALIADEVALDVLVDLEAVQPWAFNLLDDDHMDWLRSEIVKLC